MMFTPRTKPLTVGEEPWAWDVPSVYQCTWWCFWRFYQIFGVYPTYQDRSTKSGSYNNANTWMQNYRDPVEPKGLDYKPVAGDIAVYDYGDLGHVIFLETDTMTSEYRSGNPDSFRNAKLGDFKGELLGYLHYPYESINPVERNENVPQIKATDEQLRIRTQPNLDGEIVGHTKLGFYNVLSETEARVEDKVKVDGLEKWYEISKGRYCANITTEYFMPSGDDFIKEFERYINGLKTTITKVKDENADLKADMMKIEEVAEKWNL